MKTILTAILLVAMSVAGCTQNSESQMKDLVSRFKQENVDYQSLSRQFAKLSETYQEKGRASYYAAFSLILESFDTKDVFKKEILLKEAKPFLDYGLKSFSEDAEWLILNALYYQAGIEVDPKQRGYEYASKADSFLEKANKINGKNPRYYFLKGQNIFYTPVQYGGGKEKAEPFFKKANKLFIKAKQTNGIEPMWGQETNAVMLKRCQ